MAVKSAYFGLRGSKLNNALIIAVVFPAYLLFGYQNTCAGQLLGEPSWLATFPIMDASTRPASDQTNVAILQGTIVSTFNLGAFFGSLACIWIGDPLGRIKTILIGAVLMVIGAVLQCSSFGIAQLIVGRVVSGFGFGMVMATAPSWQSECATAKHRGAAVMLESVFASFGIAVAAWIVFGCSFASSSVSWRFPLALQGGFAIVLTCTTPFWPESPRWLVKHGKLLEARAVLSALRDLPPDAPEIEQELKEIEIAVEVLHSWKFRDLFTNGEQRLFHRLMLAIAVGSYQQLCGINSMAPYATTILNTYLGVSSLNARITVGGLFTWQTLCSTLGPITVDRFGRRKLFMFGAIMMGLSMAVVAGCNSLTNNDSAQIAAVAFIFIYFGSFPIGALCITFLYGSELPPLNARIPIFSVSVATTWILNFLVTEVTPLGFKNLGYQYFIVWASVNLCFFLPVIYIFFPETKNLHLEQIDAIFLQSRSVFDPVRIARDMRPDEITVAVAGGAHESDEDHPGKLVPVVLQKKREEKQTDDEWREHRDFEGST